MFPGVHQNLCHSCHNTARFYYGSIKHNHNSQSGFLDHFHFSASDLDSVPVPIGLKNSDIDLPVPRTESAPGSIAVLHSAEDVPCFFLHVLPLWSDNLYIQPFWLFHVPLPEPVHRIGFPLYPLPLHCDASYILHQDN